MTSLKQELFDRFSYHPPANEDIADLHEEVRDIFLKTAELIAERVPEGRERAVVFTKLEESMFWANAAIARNQNLLVNESSDD